MCAMTLSGKYTVIYATSSTPFKCLSPVATIASGFAFDQVIHDRQIVRGQVPNYAYIVLKESQLTRSES